MRHTLITLKDFRSRRLDGSPNRFVDWRLMFFDSRKSIFEECKSHFHVWNFNSIQNEIPIQQ